MIRDLIEQAETILVIQADNPDGDSLATSLALEQILGDLGKIVHMYCGVDIPSYLRYLPGHDRVHKELPHSFDLSIVVDTSSLDLLEQAQLTGDLKWLKGKPCIVIDHHVSATPSIDFATINYIKPAVATAEIIYELTQEYNWPRNSVANDMIATSILSDSLGMTSDGTSARSIAIMSELVADGVSIARLENNRRALQKKSQRLLKYKAQLLERVAYSDDGRVAYIHIPWPEIEEYSAEYNPSILVIDEMRHVTGVDLAIAFKTYPDGRITAKLRANYGIRIADKVAQAFGGGGHPYAAGFRVNDGRPFNEVKSECLRVANELLDTLVQNRTQIMKLYNTATRSINNLQPLKDNLITMYSCGPTVYAYPQIGNWATNIRWDILARTIRTEYELDWYMNITDVGHLVSDADDGEDKLEKGARREGKTAWEVASFYSKDFLSGLDLLNISIDRSHIVKATDHIQEQIDLVKKLEEKGYTYIIDDGVYFNSTKFADYGKMARLDLEGLQGGARVELGQKKHISDFALWKFTPAGQKRDMEWDSPWGKGFPGWHIECSAMAMKYLGETLDIHTGGIDHIPVHHTNEIAQSEAATGKTFARTWVHANFLQVDGRKMSKSLGNVYTLHDIINRGYDPRSLRMFVLQSHYQTEANFTWELLDAAKVRLQELQNFADLRFQLNPDLPSNPIFAEASKEVLIALQDNLNTPRALAIVSQIINTTANGIAAVDKGEFETFVSDLDNLLGFNLLQSADIGADIKDVIKNREQARTNKDWATSDQLRDQLLEKGITVKDTPHGSLWSRA